MRPKDEKIDLSKLKRNRMIMINKKLQKYSNSRIDEEHILRQMDQKQISIFMKFDNMLQTDTQERQKQASQRRMTGVQAGIIKSKMLFLGKQSRSSSLKALPALNRRRVLNQQMTTFV